MSEVKNARIESTMLGIEDHGVLTFFLYLDYSGSGTLAGATIQGFGGYTLDGPPVERRAGSKRVGSVFGTTAILRVLEVLGVGKWESLPGTHVRVDSDHSKVYRIGHILKDQWLDPEALAQEYACPQ